MGVTLATSLGIFTGAEISKNIASFLEENELFVPSDDDDDDWTSRFSQKLEGKVDSLSLIFPFVEKWCVN